MIYVTVKFVRSHPVSIECFPSDSVLSFKIKIKDLLGASADHGNLYFAGRALVDTFCLKDYNIRNLSIVELKFVMQKPKPEETKL